MTLRARVPAGLDSARRHAVQMVIGDWLQLPHSCETDATLDHVVIEADDGRSLAVADQFFRHASNAWLHPTTLPRLPLSFVGIAALPPGTRLQHNSLPVLFAFDAAGAPWTAVEGQGRLELDVFGSAFFLATCYEAAVREKRDAHGRFPLSASLMGEAEILSRPLGNEYAEVLRAALAQLWPGLPAARRDFRVFSTHDVDSPYAYQSCSLPQLPRAAASAARRRGNPGSALGAVAAWVRVKRFGVGADPTNNFAAIMDADEQAGAASAFFFIADPHPKGRTPRTLYRLDDPPIGDLIAHVASRGHEVGLHPSYVSFDDPARITRERTLLQAALDRMGIEDKILGGRQHFLRWDAQVSPRAWDAAGMAYDSSAAFAERPGFRTGSCLPFAMYDLVHRTSLKVTERPLILMDVSLTERRYLGLDAAGDPARALIDDLKSTCRHFGGEFVVLWHNDVLAEPGQWSLFNHAIRA